MKKSKVFLIANLSIGILLGSYTYAGAKVDSYTIVTRAGKVYEYNVKEIEESFLNNNDGLKGFLHRDFLDKLSKGEIHSYHDDSGKYVSHKKVLDVFSKVGNKKDFSLDAEVEKLGKMEMPEEVYRVSEKDDGKLNSTPVKAKDKSIYKDVNFDEDLYVTGDEILLQKVNVKGTLYVNPGVKGVTSLEDVNAGNIVILSGGKESIHFQNVFADTLSIKSSSNVRVESRGETKIGNTLVQSFAIIDNKSGSFGEVTIKISDSGEKTIELRGEFKEPIIVQTDAAIKVAEGAEVSKLEVATENKDAKVVLSGEIKEVIVSTEAKVDIASDAKIDSIITVPNAQISKDKEAEVAEIKDINGEKIDPEIKDIDPPDDMEEIDDEEIPGGEATNPGSQTGNTNTGGGSGNAGGGGSSGGDSDSSPTVYSIESINNVDKTGVNTFKKIIATGNTYNLPTEVNVRMSNGTSSRRTVTWTAPQGVTISSDGAVIINDLANYEFTGSVNGYSTKIKLTLAVKESINISWDAASKEVGNKAFNDVKIGQATGLSFYANLINGAVSADNIVFVIELTKEDGTPASKDDVLVEAIDEDMTIILSNDESAIFRLNHLNGNTEETFSIKNSVEFPVKITFKNSGNYKLAVTAVSDF
ncbi:hypothetical protein GOM49_12650 [Clostridium bovifaecis]|uniref:Bacterial Ig-like domain-containing protein n=1 Tax=Clostridium bovifaecis TaxID=2184719 RepID=A0A6I6EU38_9CLOT|nr:hypothetical protein GOM49_12650 [Clostridium bovifaecis]